MGSKIKQKKFSRTATETNADIMERIGGSGGAAYRSSKSKRPDILKLKKQSKPLTTKSDAAKMVRANKKAAKKNPRTGKVIKKAIKAGGAGVLVGAGAVASQWINQEKKK